MKRFLFVTLALALVITLGACTQGQTSAPTATPGKATAPPATPEPTVDKANDGIIETSTGTAFPIVDEPITLKAFAMAGPYNKGDFNELEIWKVYEEMTNIHIDFEAYPTSQITEKLSLTLSTNQLPDIFFKVGISNADIVKYAGQEILVPVTDYLADYAPNYSQLLDDYAEVKKTVTMQDGHIYGFPYLVSASVSNLSPKMFYNAEWMDALNLSPPETLEDLESVLIEIRDGDPNGNDEKDEIPLGADGLLQIEKALRGSFGLGTRGSRVLDFDIDETTGKLRYIYTSDEYKALLQYQNKLYTQRLIDQEIFTADLAGFTAKAEQNIIGFAFIHNHQYLGETYKENYVGLAKPLKGPAEKLMYTARTNPVAGQYYFITETNPYPEASVRWVDYFYSDDGIRLYFMGMEGVTYELDAEGDPYFNDYVKNNPDGLNWEEALGRFVPWSGGANPSIANDKYFGDQVVGQVTSDAAKALMPYTPEEVWGAFSYSEADSNRLSVLNQDIGTYVTDMRSQFITGNASFDAWDTYVTTLENMGLQELIEITQRGLDDYNSR